MTISNVLALGAGVMGAEVGFYYAMYGFDVTQYDISDEALAACKRAHRGYIESFRAARPRFSDSDIEAGLARIRYSSNLAAAARDADLVTESVPEVLEIKQQVFAELNRHCPQHTIFTTNSSTMLASAIAESTGRPERFLALHYAKPLWRASIGEIMKHPGTDQQCFDEVADFVEASGLVPIKLEKEQPGYVINSLLVPWTHAALSMAANGVCNPHDIDRTWMHCALGNLGPFAGLDITGFEVARNVIRLMAAAEPDNPQYQKNIDYLEKNFIDKGHMGASTGQGFYNYPDPAYQQPDFLK